MGKIGWGEFLVILIIALVVVGPEKLPKLGQALGKAVSSVKKYVNETSKEIEGLDELKSVKNDIESIQKDVKNMGKNLEKQITEQPSEEKKTDKEVDNNTESSEAVPVTEPTKTEESADSAVTDVSDSAKESTETEIASVIPEMELSDE